MSPKRKKGYVGGKMRMSSVCTKIKRNILDCTATMRSECSGDVGYVGVVVQNTYENQYIEYVDEIGFKHVILVYFEYEDP